MMITNNRLGLHFLDGLNCQLILLENALSLAKVSVTLLKGKRNLLEGNVSRVGVQGPDRIEDVFGIGQRWIVSGVSSERDGIEIRQVLTIDTYPQWPDAFILQWTFENLGNKPLLFDRMDCPGLGISDWGKISRRSGGPWSFQGAAVEWGQDFSFYLPEKFKRDNYLGHLEGGEGGGIPLVYCWDPQWGIALAHIETLPKNWYMPVTSDQKGGVTMALQDRQSKSIEPGGNVRGLRTLISLHQGDFYAPLSLYREVLARQGIKPAQSHSQDYEPGWCSWGYEFDVLPNEITGVLPKLKDLNLHWLCLDDRWFDNYGDWNPRSDTFPGGGAQMRQMVDQIHQAGAQIQVWWYPLAVEDGDGGYASHVYGLPEIVRQHPDWFCLNEDGSVARNNRGLAIFDPSLPEVQEYIAGLTRRFIMDWDFDGHKLDNIYTVPACYNPTHHHQRPEESIEALAEVYRIILTITHSLKPQSVVQICSCGTPPNNVLIPYMDQAVTADPTSSAQVRQRIKFYKALLGPQSAVSADHVELSDGGMDFASTIGPGGIPATKFVWPEDPVVRGRVREWQGLSNEKEMYWKKWLEIYRTTHLSDGEYLNLYDLAFDRPEAHVIRKQDCLYYAFFTSRKENTFHGPVELRGLNPRSYRLYDYVQDRWLGIVEGPRAVLEIEFEGSLLVKAIPEVPSI